MKKRCEKGKANALKQQDLAEEYEDAINSLGRDKDDEHTESLILQAVRDRFTACAVTVLSKCVCLRNASATCRVCPKTFSTCSPRLCATFLCISLEVAVVMKKIRR
jgi:hypothetical protein